MDSNPPDLSSDIKQACIPYTVSGFLRELSSIGNASEMSYNLDEYIRRLEEELRKIVVFKRELPLCMFLINDAIVALKERAVQCSTSDVGLAMEEFIPLRRDCHDDEGVKLEVDCRDKKNWMSSAQLWSCDGYSSNGINYDKKHKSAEEMKESTQEDASSAANSLFRSSKHNKTGKGAFTPFKVSDFTETGKGDNEVISVPGLSLMTPGTNTRSSEPVTSGLNPKSSNDRTAPLSSANIEVNVQNQQTSRKQRRCWSPELHRRFVTALQQLGGSRVATPKQIRELMEVDGLTNDEVKSHLQKYRIHTRRLPANASITPSHAKNVLWMPHDDQYEESSKEKVSQSGSPQGPFQLAGNAGGNSTTGGDSMEDEEDGKSESYNWKENEDDV